MSNGITAVASQRFHCSSLIAIKEGQISANKIEIAKIDRKIAENNAKIARNEAQIAAREKLITMEEAQIAAREKLITMEEAQIAAREKLITMEEAQIAAREKLIAMEEKLIAMEEKQIAARKKLIAGGEKLIAMQEAQILTTRRIIANNQESIALMRKAADIIRALIALNEQGIVGQSDEKKPAALTQLANAADCGEVARLPTEQANTSSPLILAPPKTSSDLTACQRMYERIRDAWFAKPLPEPLSRKGWQQQAADIDTISITRTRQKSLSLLFSPWR